MTNEQIELNEAELENAAGGTMPRKRPDLGEVKGARSEIDRV